MIGLGTRATKVFAYPAPVDLRKGYDGLAGLVTTGLQHRVLDGALFLFVGRTRTSCKICADFWAVEPRCNSLSGLRRYP